METESDDDVLLNSNPYMELATDARSALTSMLKNSRDDKIRKAVAESILDRAGEVKQAEKQADVVINITDEQVDRLIEALKESEDDS